MPADFDLAHRWRWEGLAGAAGSQDPKGAAGLARFMGRVWLSERTKE